MSDYYYEIDDYFLTIDHRIKSKYLHQPVNYIPDIPEKNSDRIYNLTLLSDRIWREAEDGRVYWYRNRLNQDRKDMKLNEAELKEFFWIKLRAYSI